MSTRLELLKRYLEEDPSDNFLRYALALELIALNEKIQGLNQLEKLIFDDPDYLPCYYTAGKIAEEIGKILQAEELFKRGIEVARNQKNIQTLNELNEALSQLEH